MASLMTPIVEMGPWFIVTLWVQPGGDVGVGLCAPSLV